MSHGGSSTLPGKQNPVNGCLLPAASCSAWYPDWTPLLMRRRIPPVAYDQRLQFYPAHWQGTSERLLLTLPASKTDPFRRGITLTIAAAGDSACAVAVLYRPVTTWPAGPRAPDFQTRPSIPSKQTMA